MPDPVPLPEAFLRLPLAHRGLHDRARGRVENSRAAVRAAIAAGYGIEIDVQLSGDGVAVVFHDARLDRLTGEHGPVRDRTIAELTRIPLTDADECIPTLKEIADLVAGRVPLLVEIKDQSGDMGPDNHGIEAAVASALCGYDGPLALMSFNPHSVAAIGRLLPDRPRGRATDPFHAEAWPGLAQDRRAALARIRDLEELGASFVSHHRPDLSSPEIARVKRARVPVLTWTIRSPEQEAEARRIADNITFEGYAAQIPA